MIKVNWFIVIWIVKDLKNAYFKSENIFSNFFNIYIKLNCILY